MRERVLDATMVVIARHGVERVRIGDIAAESGFHETSIYRRWSTVQALLVDALISRVTADLPMADTGSLQGDLSLLGHELAAFYRTPAGRAFVPGILLTGDDTQPEITAALKEFWQQRFTFLEPIFDRAKARGEMREDIDPQIVMILVGAFVNFCVTFLGSDVPSDYIDQAVSVLIAGLRVEQENRAGENAGVGPADEPPATSDQA